MPREAPTFTRFLAALSEHLREFTPEFAEAESGMVGALHAVNALLIFWLAVATAIRVTRGLRSLDRRV